MEIDEENKIKKVLKKVYPQMMALAKDEVCPSEDALASFAEGKLEGKKEEQVIAHLAFCNDCLEIIKSLRQKPSEEEVSVPLPLEKTVCNLFPEEPKTWEIVVEHVKTALEVIKHTAEQCWTIPTLELIPSEMELQPAYLFRNRGRIFSDPYVTRKGSVPVPDLRNQILESVRKRHFNGFVFLKQIGSFGVSLVITKDENKRPRIFEVEIDVCGRSGRTPEEIEVSFIQGQTIIEKVVTRKDAGISKRLSPNKYSIKFEHKGVCLGEAVLDLREEKLK